MSDSAGMNRPASPSEMGRILVGERLGHFQLEEFVGGGGMGAVFRATDMMLGRTVAVKVLSRDQTQETLERFTREARNAALLDHERIARVYYVNEDKGWHYIVFEYIEGVNVRDLVDVHGPLSIDEAIFFTLQVTEALRHAAQKEVVHRDIKPSNILIMPDGRAKLVDMGLAHSRQVEASQNDLTESGVTLGTFDYISPEQAREPRAADVRSDIYSLGCTLYYMLTGRPPFPEGTVLQKLLSHSSEAPPDPRQYRHDVPEEVVRLLMKMLAKNPTQRFQRPDDLIDELLRVANVLGLERTSSSVAGWTARPLAPAPWYEKHLPWAAPVITLLLVILGLEWFQGAPAAQQPPRPTLLPPITTATKQPGPQIPVARNTNTIKPSPEKVTDLSSAENGEKKVETPATTENKPETDVAETEKPPENDNKTGITDPAPPVTPQTLVVGPAGTARPADARLVSTLAEAVEAISKSPEIKVIELHFDGERTEVPVALAAADLTIRAGENKAAGVKFKPVLVYRPTLALQRIMIEVSGKKTSFQDVQFRLELPQESTSDAWALFSVAENTVLNLKRCALTIDNVDDEGSRHQLSAAFFEIIAPDEIEFDEFGVNFVRPHIELSSTLARGEAMLVRSESGIPFHLKWAQGLLVTPERFADIGGTPRALDNIELGLERVTVHAKAGMFLFRDGKDARNHAELRIDSKNSIYFTDPNAAFVEHRTLENVEELKQTPPRFKGDDDRFIGAKDYWRITPLVSGDLIEPVSIPFGEEARSYGFQGAALLGKVMWKGLPPLGKPVHAYSVADYEVEANYANYGFDPTKLPDFYIEPTAPKPRDPAPAEATPTPSPPVTVPSGMSDKMKMMMTPATSPKPPLPPVEAEPLPKEEK